MVHISDPDSKHLNDHGVDTCVGKNFTRKENLIKHYKKYHGHSNSPELADLSKHTVDLKHFACGFCGFYCGSLDDLINHVDDHYRNLACASDWDDNKVIRTLLSLHKYWRDYLAARPDPPESAFVWDASHVEELQRRLQEGREPADSLCKAAFDKSNFGTSQHDHAESASHAKESISASQSRNPNNRIGFTHGPTPQSETLTSITHKQQCRPHYHNNGTGKDPTSHYPRIQWTQSYGSPTSVKGYDAGPPMQPIGTPSSGERFVHHQHLAQPHAGSFHPALRAQSTSSSLSSDREASSLGQPNSTYSPEHHFTNAAQVSRPGMRYGRG